MYKNSLHVLVKKYKGSNNGGYFAGKYGVNVNFEASEPYTSSSSDASIDSKNNRYFYKFFRNCISIVFTEKYQEKIKNGDLIEAVLETEGLPAKEKRGVRRQLNKILYYSN